MVKKIEFHDFLKENNLDLAKVNLITALIFLNIACLHHVPYDSFLFILGHKMLDDCIS